jgi:hypothetical protein
MIYSIRLSDIEIRIQDKMACVIMQDIRSASFHLADHVAKDGDILTLDANCEYCQVYINERRILPE